MGEVGERVGGIEEEVDIEIVGVEGAVCSFVRCSSLSFCPCASCVCAGCVWGTKNRVKGEEGIGGWEGGRVEEVDIEGEG
jgi:hypothetical protein